MKKILLIITAVLLFSFGCASKHTPNNLTAKVLPQCTKNMFIERIHLNEEGMHNILDYMLMYDGNDVSMSGDMLSTLSDHATWLRNNPKAVLIIEGHGSTADVAKVRALSAYNHLKFLGIKEKQLYPMYIVDNFQVVMFDIVLPDHPAMDAM